MAKIIKKTGPNCPAQKDSKGNTISMLDGPCPGTCISMPDNQELLKQKRECSSDGGTWECGEDLEGNCTCECKGKTTQSCEGDCTAMEDLQTGKLRCMTREEYGTIKDIMQSRKELQKYRSADCGPGSSPDCQTKKEKGIETWTRVEKELMAKSRKMRSEGKFKCKK